MSGPRLHVEEGDCLDVLRRAPDKCVSAIVTDPPYALEFMGKGWDKVLPSIDVWGECLRVVEPGGLLLAFGGTRTYHRLTCAIEDAGWEIRDCLMWVYGQGFPKGKTCLKPAWEPIVLARAPGKARHLNIDACRVDATDGRPLIVSKSAMVRAIETRFLNGSKAAGTTTAGRWPANLVHDGSDEVLAAFPQQSSGSRAVGVHRVAGGQGRFGEFAEGEMPEVAGSKGSAARFFYAAKASKADRGEGNTHPTVKPVELMRWLVRLVAKPGQVVLDPFCGSGTTLVACAAEGVDGFGIEREAAYAEIARSRLEGSWRVAG